MNGPRRIAWVVYGSLEQVSGGYIYDRLIVEQLRALGDSVTVISLTPGASDLPAFFLVFACGVCAKSPVPSNKIAMPAQRCLI